VLEEIQQNFQQEKVQAIEQEKEDQIERMSNANQFYKGFKSNKLRAGKLIGKSMNTGHSYGVGTLPSDNMGQIMTHAFQQEYVDFREKKQHSEKERQLNVKATKRGQHTKASNLRKE